MERKQRRTREQKERKPTKCRGTDEHCYLLWQKPKGNHHHLQPLSTVTGGDREKRSHERRETREEKQVEEAVGGVKEK